MTAKLCSQVPESFAKAHDREVLFVEKAEKDKLKTHEAREQPKFGIPGKSCETELFFGFFFDGTRNNYEQADKGGTRNHSNIARLYDCFPGLSVPGVLPAETDWDYKLDRYTHFFRTSIPGVGSPFKQVRDASGAWVDAAVSDQTSTDVENSILTRARQLRLSNVTN